MLDPGSSFWRPSVGLRGNIWSNIAFRISSQLKKTFKGPEPNVKHRWISLWPVVNCTKNHFRTNTLFIKSLPLMFSASNRP